MILVDYVGGILLKNNVKSLNYLSPKLGILGILGFVAPVLYINTHSAFTIVFLAFIGFFAFYFTGKISTLTFKKEILQINENKAESLSFKFAMISILISMIISFRINNSFSYIFLIGAISLIWGITMILKYYFLYTFLKNNN